MKNKFSKMAGFSLVELMVVVGIIGILATIAVPNFRKFQANAKAGVARSELSNIYTGLVANFQETGNYNQTSGADGTMVALATIAGAGTVGGLGIVLPATNRFYNTSIGVNAQPSTNCAAAAAAPAGVVVNPQSFVIGSGGCPFQPNVTTHTLTLSDQKAWVEAARNW